MRACAAINVWMENLTVADGGPVASACAGGCHELPQWQGKVSIGQTCAPFRVPCGGDLWFTPA